MIWVWQSAMRATQNAWISLSHIEEATARCSCIQEKFRATTPADRPLLVVREGFHTHECSYSGP